jgi:hypothetical protein
MDASGKVVAPAQSVSFDLKAGDFGWFGVVVSGATSYEVSAKLTITGFARDKDGKMLVPWNFYYYPFQSANTDGAKHPSAKWQAKFADQANAWEQTSYWASETDGSGRGSGFAGHGITQAYVDAYNAWAGTTAVDFNDTWWWGHCDAASVASALFADPAATPDFTQDDMEYFATEIAMRGYEIELKFFLGGLTNTNRRSPAHTEKPTATPGQALDGDIGAFHEALIDVVKNQGSVALVDFRAEWVDGEDHSADVWNQATYKFTMEATQAVADKTLADQDPNARKIAWKTTLYANCDSMPNPGDPESNPDSAWQRVCTYVLNYDATGKVVLDHPQNNFQRVTWAKTGKDYYAPRYIFQIKGLNPKGTGPGNPFITLEKAQALGLGLRPIFGGK